MNVLVLCTGNSARSILLEALLNRLGQGRIAAFSAGSRPAGRVHPQSLRMLAEKGLEASAARSKSWDEFAAPGAPAMDVVITVCDSAAGETCPIWPGAPVRTHWGIDDPAAAPEPERACAFERAHAILERRARALLGLPLEDMPPEALKAELDRIGRLP